ncbi:MAG: glycogen debranching protein [Clostridia bacterium]|nr:glycogen debranching protein [Clostridia bacterium]
MVFTKDNLKLEEGLKKEWLITNGIGGFASSTIIGANTRKYHGLLIAPLTPPARRFLVLSKVDESIKIGDNNYNLYTNIGENYISQGYQYQVSFNQEAYPTFNYQVEGVSITKSIVMKKGENVVGISYKINNLDKTSKLTLAPIVNFRDFHTMSTDHNFEVRQLINGTKVKLIIDGKSDFPLYMNLSEGNYIKHDNNTFKDMFYIEEEKRGFYPKENHNVPGVFEVEIKPNEEKYISFVFGMEENIEEVDVKDILKNEEKRIEKLVQKSEILQKSEELKSKEIELRKALVKAADQFIVFRPSFGLHTMIAGYPWFLDWGRDTLIAFEGILLKTKRFDIAKEVLLTMIKDIKYGLVPNGYSGFDNRPLYNSVDASLLLFEQIKKYINYTGDYDFVKEKIYEKLQKIIESYCKGIDVDNNNIYLDKDFLISSGTENTQNTWMDAKYGDMPATPRNGKAVEINSLWYNSLMIMADLTKKIGNSSDVEQYRNLAKKCKKSFNKEFYNTKRKCLYDVIGDNKIRPNQLFSLSLTYPVIDANSEIANEIINVVEKKLLNQYGLKSLAKGEKNYIEIYEGNSFKRDMSYHQGITWTWLLGLYYDALRNMIKVERRKTYKIKLEEKLKKFQEKTRKTFEKEIFERGCIGSIAEIYDSVRPYEPKGTIAQAWSVSEIIRILTD